MMSPSLLILVALLFILGYKAKERNDGSITKAYERFKQQIAQFLPRMILNTFRERRRLATSPLWRFRRYVGPSRARGCVHHSRNISRLWRGTSGYGGLHNRVVHLRNPQNCNL